jgi:hypothetical protein
MLENGIQLSNYFYFEIWHGLVQVPWLVFPRMLSNFMMKLPMPCCQNILWSYAIIRCLELWSFVVEVSPKVVKLHYKGVTWSFETLLHRGHLKLCCRKMKLWNFVGFVHVSKVNGIRCDHVCKMMQDMIFEICNLTYT